VYVPQGQPYLRGDRGRRRAKKSIKTPCRQKQRGKTSGEKKTWKMGSEAVMRKKKAGNNQKNVWGGEKAILGLKKKKTGSCSIPDKKKNKER